MAFASAGTQYGTGGAVVVVTCVAGTVVTPDAGGQTKVVTVAVVGTEDVITEDVVTGGTSGAGAVANTPTVVVGSGVADTLIVVGTDTTGAVPFAKFVDDDVPVGKGPAAAT